jgi:hypothetical protein
MLRPENGPVRALTGLLALLLAGCGSGGPVPGSTATSPPAGSAPEPHAALAGRAAAAQDRVEVSFYSLVTADHPEERTVMVVRDPEGGWRVDIPGGALGGTADVSMVGIGDRRYQCTLADPPDPSQGAEGRPRSVAGGEWQCVEVDPLPAAADPRVHHVFTDWLDVLTDRSAAVAISQVPPLDGSAAGDCFSVEPSAASLLAPLDAGIYCFQPDGTLTGAELNLGTLRLVGTDAAAPPAVELPGPVVAGGPLPIASPTASPTPSPTPSASPTADPG